MNSCNTASPPPRLRLLLAPARPESLCRLESAFALALQDLQLLLVREWPLQLLLG